MTGIYEIRNTATGDRYVGSALDVARRLEWHVARLRSGKHYNNRLQKAWSIFGEGVFVYWVLEKVFDRDTIYAREQAHIDEGAFYNQLKRAERKPYRRGEITPETHQLLSNASSKKWADMDPSTRVARMRRLRVGQILAAMLRPTGLGMVATFQNTNAEHVQRVANKIRTKFGVKCWVIEKVDADDDLICNAGNKPSWTNLLKKTRANCAICGQPCKLHRQKYCSRKCMGVASASRRVMPPPTSSWWLGLSRPELNNTTRCFSEPKSQDNFD